MQSTTDNNETNLPVIGQKKSKDKTPKNAPNTMRSKGRARFVEILSEGPIEGLVNGEQSIYFDQTPLKAPDGTYNFANVDWEFHHGLPDEGYFHGQSAVETPVQVGVEVKHNAAPVSRTIIDKNADAVRVIIRVNSLFAQGKQGNLTGASVHYVVEVRAHDGAWQMPINNILLNQKSVSPFQIAHRVELPVGGHPWEIRVRRINPDSTSDDVQDSISFDSYVVLVEGKFTYPNTAAVAMEVNAEDMGSSIPPRFYHVRGLRINVPSNYDPYLRKYYGIWDGTFKIAWTNNPAWIFYDLLTNDRYGLGEFVSPHIVDKWSLYLIAQYCDQSIPSGYKNGDTGKDIYEPRFTFNGAINSRDEAFFVLQTITKAWRGMAYWALGQVFATADMPGDPVKLVTPSNVVKGEFDYAGTAIKARHSVIMVRWNDPSDFYAPAVEAVIDSDLLAKYGWREKSLQLQGCTSRGLAHRYGKWIIDSEQHETETVTYQAGWDHADVRPGDIIAISDPNKANIRAGGRIKRFDDLVVELDADFEAREGEAYQLIMTMPDGKLETRPIAGFIDKRTARIASAYSATPVDNAVWTIKGTDIHPRLFRVITIKEDEPNIFSISALFHDPQKFDRIEKGIIFEPLPYERPSKTSIPPHNLYVRENGYVSNGQSFVSLTLSWEAPQNFLARGFVVSVDTPEGDHIVLGTTQNTYFEMLNTVAGNYKFYVETLSYIGVTSIPATIEYEAKGVTGYALPVVKDLELIDNPNTDEFTGRDLRVKWKNLFALSTNSPVVDIPSPHYQNNTVKVYNSITGQLLRSEQVHATSYIYNYETNVADNERLGNTGATRHLRVEVVVNDVFGRHSAPAVRAFSNPTPAAIAPIYQVNGSSIYIGYEPSSDLDFEGVMLFRSTTPGIDPLKAKPIYDGKNNPFTVIGEPDTTYYFKIAAYDAFGKDGLNYSSEFVIRTLYDIDVTPPSVPTGLTVESKILNGKPRITVSWKANGESDLAGYDIQIKQDNGNWVSVPIVNGPYEFDGVANSKYQIRIRSRDKAGNTSAYTDITTHVAARDTVPPAPPVFDDISAGTNSLWLRWTNPTDEDLSHVEIFESLSNDGNKATMIAEERGTGFARVSLDPQSTRFYWLRAVDTSGNKSSFVGPRSATTSELPEPKRFQITGLTFTPNSPSANKVSWSAHQISYGQAGQTGEVRDIAAGSATWTSGSLYIYYVAGDKTLRVTDRPTTVFIQSGHPIAVYRGNKDIAEANGKVIIDGDNILAGTIGSKQLVTNDAVITGSAQIKNAIINDAKIVDLDASKLKANSILTDTILVGKDTLATIRERAENPTPQINKGATLIDPGKILISGETSLANWRMGGDETRINGGNISANTIQANSLVIGSRNITVDGITFAHNSPSTNRVSWTSGTVSYIDDDGKHKIVNIAGDNVPWLVKTLYIYWVKGETTLRVSTEFNIANQNNTVVMATYRGGIYLFASYGRTTIEGNQITTGSIKAEQIMAGAIGARQISANAIAANHIGAGAINADHIAANAINANHISSNSIHGHHITADSIHANRIIAETITADRIKYNGIETDRLNNNATSQMSSGSAWKYGRMSSVLHLPMNMYYGNILFIVSLRGSPGRLIISENDYQIDNPDQLGNVIIEGNYSGETVEDGERRTQVVKETLIFSRDSFKQGYRWFTFKTIARNGGGTLYLNAYIINFKR